MKKAVTFTLAPAPILATMHLPLAYLLEKNTELSDAGSTLVDLTQRNVCTVQEPVSFRLLFVVGRIVDLPTARPQQSMGPDLVAGLKRGHANRSIQLYSGIRLAAERNISFLVHGEVS